MSIVATHIADPEAPAATRPASAAPLSARAILLVAIFYFCAVLVATYPVLLAPRTRMIPWNDPGQQLWVMRWFKSCVLEGRSPLLARGIQHPIGAPLGHFSPQHLQAFLYFLLSSAISNDILTYNLIWLIGFLLTGMGTFFLAHWALGDLACAAFAGMLAMLSGPMVLHARGHIELIYVGFFPVFLVAWIRFVDGPTVRRLAAAAIVYLLVAASAAYFGLFAVFPAALYVVGQAMRAGRAEMVSWLRSRAFWLLGFLAAVAPFMVLLFAGHLLAGMQGQQIERTRSEFLSYGAPPWSYFIPSGYHFLGKLIPFKFYEAAGKGLIQVEVVSYLGVITCSLVLYAMLRRVPLRKKRYLWSAFALLVVLSLGACWRFGSHWVPLPDWWLWKAFLPFRLTRVPARFNLLAAVCAAVLAAAGLKHLLACIRRPAAQKALYAALVLFTILDLAPVPYPTFPLPAMPASYHAILACDPRATFLEVPLFESDDCHALNSLCGYWQSFHGGKTSAGYSGHPNPAFDEQIVFGSPFSIPALADTRNLSDPHFISYGIVRDVPFLDYAWLFLQAHDFRYVVVHHWTKGYQALDLPLDRLEALLRPARISGDDVAAVYDRSLLPPPSRPTVLWGAGWHYRKGWPGPPTALVEKNGRIIVYNPDADRPLQLVLQAQAFRKPRTVRVLCGQEVLASLRLAPEEMQTYWTAPFSLSKGIHELTLRSDGEERPRRRLEAIAEGNMRPHSFFARELNVRQAPATGTVATEPRLVR